MKSKLFLLIMMGLILLVSAASAAVNISVSKVSPTFIEWTWDAGQNVSSVSIDGWTVYAFDHSSNQFLLSDLPQNETHTILVVTNVSSETNTATTLPSTTKQEMFFNVLYIWGYLILVAIFIAIGMQRKLGIFLIVASLVSLYALYVVITTTTPGSDPLVELPFYVYIMFFLFPHYLAFRKGGYTK